MLNGLFCQEYDAADKISLHIIEEQAKIRQFQIGAYNGTLNELQGRTWEKIIVSLEKLPFLELLFETPRVQKISRLQNVKERMYVKLLTRTLFKWTQRYY